MGLTSLPQPKAGSGPGKRLLLLLGLLLFGFALLPEGRLGCADPVEREAGPGGWSLTLCRRFMPFAMPGHGGDAPGWVVLRDPQGSISGVVGLGLLQSFRAATGLGTEWKGDRVVVPLAAELPLQAATGPFARWLRERGWVWRALLGLVPTDDMFR